MFKKVCIAACLIFFPAVFVTAQSAEKVTEMISSENATYGQVCYFSAVYQGLIDESASESDAVEALKNAGILKSSIQENTAINLCSMAYIYAKTLKISGGIMYTLFPSKRYALRELKANGIIPDALDPGMKVNGRLALNYFNACMTRYAKDTEGAN